MQEIRLPCKVTTQRLTWVLLLLTVLVAWWIVPLFDPKFNPDQWERKPPTNPELADEEQPRWYRTPDAMAKRIERYLPETLPAVRDHLPDVARPLEKVPDAIGGIYYGLHENLVKEGIPLAEIFLGTFLLLTFLSWWTHREWRTSRVGRGLAATNGAD